VGDIDSIPARYLHDTRALTCAPSVQALQGGAGTKPFEGGEGSAKPGIVGGVNPGGVGVKPAGGGSRAAGDGGEEVEVEGGAAGQLVMLAVTLQACGNMYAWVMSTGTESGFCCQYSNKSQ
jgi:hypothetical protein